MASFFPFRSYKAWRLWEHRTPPHNYWTLLLCEAAVYSHRWKKCSTLVLYYNIWHIKAAWLCHPAEPHLEALKSYTFCNTLKVNGSFTRLKKAHFKNFHFCTQFHHKCFGFIQKALYAILLSYGTYAKIVFSPHRSTSFTHIAIFSSKQKIMVAWKLSWSKICAF